MYSRVSVAPADAVGCEASEDSLVANGAVNSGVSGPVLTQRVEKLE